jgi:HEPN domain-containing protein
MTTLPTEPPDFGLAVFNNLLDLFVRPEIQRRQREGLLPTSVDIHAAQVIMFPDGRPNLVRLNNEVRAIANIRVRREVKAGDPVYSSDIAEVERLRLSEPEFGDCGHATMFAVGHQWHVAFNFIYNRAKAENLLTRTHEFLRVAEHALGVEAWHPFADTLFSAAELSAKAFLLFLGGPELAKRANHRAIHKGFNNFGRIGNVDPNHLTAFNELAELRIVARYDYEPLTLSHDEAAKLLAAVSPNAACNSARHHLPRAPLLRRGD